MIFTKTALRIADRANQPRIQVRPAIREIEDLAAHRIEQHCVDCEIAAQRILPGIYFEMDAIRMTAIEVLQIAAESRHLHLRACPS